MIHRVLSLSLHVSRLASQLATPLVWLSVLAFFAGCSGSGSPTKIDVQNCDPDATGGALCLVSCNLGCTLDSCSLTEIAQNQQITFVFSQELDPRTVNSSTVSFRTAAGEEPVGQLVVAGATVTFVPEVRIVGSRSFFGFRANETYALSLPARGAPELVRSTSGDSLTAALNCSLRVSRGVIDADGQPPEAELRSPNSGAPVDPRTPIVLEWSELIEAAPFLGEDPPVRVRVRETRTVDGRLECDPQATQYDLSGSWRVENDPFSGRTRATFAASQAIPGSVCVEVEISDRIRDMAGNAGGRQFFRYLVRPQQRAPTAIRESFDNDLQLDSEGSSGSWTAGEAAPGRLGGSGRLGVFQIENGELQGDTYVWNVDNVLIPRTQTLSGEDVVVTDGVFEFERFVLPPNRKLKFIGSRPPRIYSRGVIDIQGTIDVSAIDNPAHTAGAVGQVAEAAGPFGGRGGRGGDRGRGAGPDPRFDGSNGEDIRLTTGHAYARRAVGTGGRGSPLYPASGRDADVTYGPRLISLQSTSAGGGGGHVAAGGDGTTTSSVGAPASRGGNTFDVLPVPSGVDPLDHLLVGGSGGGGAGSHPLANIAFQPILWRSGGAGGSGGGALLLRAGGDVRVRGAGEVLARGGGTAMDTRAANGVGGGGSGGSVVIQLGGVPTLTGRVDVLGGAGGTGSQRDSSVVFDGGDGGAGIILVQAPQAPSASVFGDARPPTSVRPGALLDRDAVVGATSKFYRTGELFPPKMLRYELVVRTAAGSRTFSDDPGVGPLADASAPVRLIVQGGRYDPNLGAVDPESHGPWRDRVGAFGAPSLDDDRRDSVRFVLQFRDPEARVEDLQIVFLPR